MRKARRIIALIGVILLVLLYVSTLILAIVDKSASMKFFQASVIATIVIPVLFWAVTFFMGQNKKDVEDQFHNETNSDEK